MKTLKSTLSVLYVLAILLSACAPSASSRMAQSALRRESEPNVAEGDLQSLAASNNAFALEMYSSLSAEDGNLILSPYSISLALAMTYAGARGETESQMAQALHFNLPAAQLHPTFNALDLALHADPISLDKDQEPLRLEIANAVWAEQTYPFLDDFLNTLAENYGAGVHLADFINDPDAERKGINNWVADQTEGRIKDLLAEGTINPATRMVLVNAIYFKADWLSQFKKDSTSESTFHLLDGSTVEVPTMHQGAFIPYAQGEAWQAAELPYAGGNAAMTLLVPDEGNFEEFESALDVATLDSILAQMESASVQFALPKFTFTRDFGLADQLAALGMPDAFNADVADFSGMTGNRDLFISDVIHKAFVAVDEEGTEAAAATTVIMETTSAPMFDIVLLVDRPFIFLIRDTVSGQILFMGRVLNPAN